MRKCTYTIYVKGHNPTEFNRSGNELVTFTDGLWTGWGVDFDELEFCAGCGAGPGVACNDLCQESAP